MNRTSILGLVLALLATGTIFGTAYFVVYVVPTMAGGDVLVLMRWAAMALIGGLLLYRLYARVGRSRKKKPHVYDDD